MCVDGRGSAPIEFTVFSKASGLNDAETAVVDLQSGQYRIMFKGAEAHFVEPGAMVFLRAGAYHAVALAPGGRRVAAGILEAGRCVIRLLDPEQRRDELLELSGSNWQPVWHPDGRRLAFCSMRNGDFDVHWKNIMSTAPPEPLLMTEQDEDPMAFTPDGRAFIVSQSEPDGASRQNCQ